MEIVLEKIVPAWSLYLATKRVDEFEVGPRMAKQDIEKVNRGKNPRVHICAVLMSFLRQSLSPYASNKISRPDPTELIERLQIRFNLCF
jgi:hypothetical protein